MLQKGSCLKPIVSKYHPNSLSCLEIVPEKVHSAELKPIVALGNMYSNEVFLLHVSQLSLQLPSNGRGHTEGEPKPKAGPHV